MVRQLQASERALGEELVQVGQGGGGVGVVLVEPESDRQVDIDLGGSPMRGLATELPST